MSSQKSTSSQQRAADKKKQSASNKPPSPLPYERTSEESDRIVHGEVTAHFKRKEPERRFLWIQKWSGGFLNNAFSKTALVPQQSNYSRIMGKNKSRKASSAEVKKQQEELERDFLLTSGLTKEALYDESKVEKKWEFKLGEPLVQHLSDLTTQMRRFHAWYMEQSKRGRCMFAYKYRHCDFLHGDGENWIYFDEMYQLYQQDALGVQLLSLWTL